MTISSSEPIPRIVLASSSPYRRALLTRLLLPFEVATPNIDESACPNETPSNTALRLAHQKALAVAALFPNAIVIGSDQVASLDDKQIGKPGCHEKALAQLRKMRGKEVLFHTAVCVHDNRQDSLHKIQIDQVQTKVLFCNLPDAQLDAYLRIEQPYDCAGSAKNEGLGIALIQRCVSNDPTALTGLPLITLCDMLRKIGIKFFSSGPG
jgi:septum formation protein